MKFMDAVQAAFDHLPLENPVRQAHKDARAPIMKPSYQYRAVHRESSSC
jgi:hypothetical protein